MMAPYKCNRVVALFVGAIVLPTVFPFLSNDIYEVIQKYIPFLGRLILDAGLAILFTWYVEYTGLSNPQQDGFADRQGKEVSDSPGTGRKDPQVTEAPNSRVTRPLDHEVTGPPISPPIRMARSSDHEVTGPPISPPIRVATGDEDSCIRNNPESDEESFNRDPESGDELTGMPAFDRRKFEKRRQQLTGMTAFDIPNKGATISDLTDWRQLSLTLNPKRRFRYVANLAKREQLQRRQELKIANSFAAMVQKNDKNDLSHFGGIEGMCQRLNVDPKIGLDDGKYKENLKLYGPNTYPEKSSKGLFLFVWEAMQDWSLIVLFVCAGVSFGVGIATKGSEEGWYDGTGILFSIVLGVFVTALSDWQQSLQRRVVNQRKKEVFIQATRDGRTKKVSMFDLVMGDIVHLSAGDLIPADGLLIEGCELTVCKCEVTGKRQPQLKSSEEPFLLSGTSVSDGFGLMLVTGVGYRQLMATHGEDEDLETPLQVKLSLTATFIGKLGLAFVLLTFFVFLGRYLYSKYAAGGITEWSGEDIVTIVNFFSIQVAMIVLAVSEELPLAENVVVAFAMKKMLHDKALVRRSKACETLGSVTTICTDKSGILTTNKMTIVKACIAGCTGSVSEIKQKLSSKVRELLIENIYTNTTGYVGDDLGVGGRPDALIGTPMETALLVLGLSLGGHFGATREKFKIVKVNPFNSAKRMAVVVKHPDGHLRAHWKGAAELVLGMCNRTIDAAGKVVDLTESTRRDLGGKIDSFGDQALRTLCLAYSDDLPDHCVDIPKRGLVCLAIVGIKDPVRLGVPEAVKVCFAAGIKVRMVTGDNIHTAVAVARTCGILTDGEVVNGADFRSWTEEEKKKRIPNIQVMARSSPSDKLSLVKYLQELGEVVAVTGRSYDDARALSAVDVGVAMGNAGTEVAKKRADVIILDDDFRTIVGVAKWGRAVYTNLQKFVQFQLTMILVALVTNFTSACFSGQAPLTVVQVVWVKLIMDTLGQLVLATEPPHDDLMKKAVESREVVISNIMWRNVLGQIIYQVTVLDLLQSKVRDFLHLQGSEAEMEAQLNTIIFNTFVFCQVFNLLNAREMEKLNVFAHTFGKFWVFLLIITSTAVFQWIMVSYLDKLASTVPLTGYQWGVTVGLGAFSMLVAMGVKFIPVRKKKIISGSLQTYDDGYRRLPGGPSGEENV